MYESEHYDLAIRQKGAGWEAVLKLNVGNIKHEESVIPLQSGEARLILRTDSLAYRFYVLQGEAETYLGEGQSRLLSSEVAGGFTGVMLGLYAVGKNQAEFRHFSAHYTS